MSHFQKEKVMNLEKPRITRRVVLCSYFILSTWAVCGYATELHEAVDLRDAQRVQELVDNSTIDIDEKNDAGDAALHIAARKGWTDMALILLSAGADVNVRHRIVKATPTHFAAKEGHLETVLALMDYDADVNATVDHSPTRLLTKLTTFMDNAERITDYSAEHTAAYWAYAYGHMDIVEALEAAGAQPVSLDEDSENSIALWGKEMIQLVLRSAHAG